MKTGGERVKTLASSFMKSALRARSGVTANGHVPISPLAGVFISEVTVAPSVTASRDTSPEGGGKGSERLHSFICEASSFRLSDLR